ncbi:methylenetetrahydrofolate reductase 1 [Coemansia sp. RSA 552]|nr:methylenetetrahydrofolate reductase 1 [Coemansia sp. RSA 552]
MKVADKLTQVLESEEPFFSFEYFPPMTGQGLANLYDRIERMSRAGPVFVAVTWGAGGATAQRTLELCSACQGVFGIETVMHLTCTNMDRGMVDEALEGAKQAGIQNILALRGDVPRGEEYWTACADGFTHAVDLVRYIREKHGDYFCIGVAGYPEGHVENQDKDGDFQYFVEKVQAGADFVISQLVYDPALFVAWERRCRASGITVPIVPGVLPIQSYQSFRRLEFLTKVSVPEALRARLEDIKTNDQAVKDLGVEHAVAMIRQLREAGVRGVHLTTLNLENTVQRVLETLGMGRPLRTVLSQQNVAARAAAGASSEQSDGGLAVAGTAQRRVWDDFPNGRWGDARSPAFGNLDAYGAMLRFDAQRAMQVWGRPKCLEDVSALFVRYVEGKIPSLPWSDEPLLPETARIGSELVRLNTLGYWTLASQPALDGVDSGDQTHGWGPRGGYVYQKAFVECFVPGEVFPPFLSRLQSSPGRITYYAFSKKGDYMTNAHAEEGTALTWGVFPGRAVVQPTLIDKMSFTAWCTEAFQTWREWASMFPSDSEEARFLGNTADQCWLVNVIDNDYKKTDAIWDIFA